MGKKKAMAVVKAGVATSLLVAPISQITFAQTYNDPAVSWSNVSFQPYLNKDGTVIFDPANEPGISPDDVDFSSGYSKGSGDKPSFYVGSDGANLFFRMRLLGNPYDRKGGYLSSVWLVDIAENGVHKATVGLNGKSPHEDYIYVSNAKGTVINKINKTDSSGSQVPGSRIVETENGEYFLDFQVPISRITEVAPDITANSAVQFFFGTSKAANLSVINKDYMGPNTGVSFTNAASVKLNPAISFQIPTIAFTNLANFESQTPTFTGTTTKAANGSEVTLTINNKTYKTTVSNGTWTVVIPANEPLPIGTYPVTAKVINEYQNMAMTKQEVTVGQTITIDGPSTIRVSSFPSTVSGTFTNNTSGSKKVKFTVRDSSGTTVYSANAIQADSLKRWSKTGISINPPLPEGTYVIEAVEDINNGNTNLPKAYKTVIIDNQINVAISSPQNNTSSPEANPTVTGTADPNAKVELFIDGQFYRELIADLLGNWTTEVDRSLSPGAHLFRAKATDEIGNTKDSLEVRYTVTSLDIDIANGPKVETNDNLPTIRGTSTAPDGSVVKVKISDTLTLQTTVKSGKWSVNVEEPLNDQTYQVVATVTSGELTAQDQQELIIDSTTFVSITSPTVGTITDNKRESITGKSEPFATIDINLDNGAIVGTVFADQNGDWSYTPDQDLAYGQHQVTVTSSDVNGNNAVETTSFSVNTPGNKIPTVPSYQEATGKNKAISGTVVGTDADGDALTYSLGANPTHGAVVVNEDGTWTFAPSDDYVGVDTFTVTVSDGKGGTATATITIQVIEPPNQLPTIETQDLEKSTLKNTAVSGKVTGTDADGDTLTYTVGTTPTHGTAVVRADGTWTYTPSNGYVGTDSFTVTVSDGKGGTATATIKIEVTEPPNKVPTIETQDLEKSTLKNTAVSGKVTGTDPDGDTLTYTVGTTPTHGTAVVRADGTWTYTPSDGYVGTDSFTVTVSDGKGGTATATIKIEVTEPPNQLPTIETQDLEKSTLKNTAVSGKVTGTDADGDTLTFSVETNPTYGTVLFNPNGTWTYTPNDGYVGTDSFTVTVSDGNGGTDTATITIQVIEPPNQLPTIETQDLEKSTLKNTAVSGKVTGTDADGDTLTYTVGTTPTHGTAVVRADGTWTYTPSNGYVGTDSFTVTVSDGKGGTATATIKIEVNEPPNKVPTIETQDLEKSTLKNTAVSGKVTGTDADDDTLTYTVGTTPTHGTAVVRADGTWTYTPSNGYIGTDSFTVTVSDGKGGTATATIKIEVSEPPNQLPTIGTQDLEKSTLKNTAVSGKVTGTDPDGDALTFSVETNPTHGTVLFNPNGTWTYTPNDGYVGTDSFTVTVSDGKGGTATATIKIEVTEPPNHAPTVEQANQEASTLRNTPVGGTVNATDADGDALTYTVGTTPTHGTVVVNPDGTWTYTPSNGYVGTDTFTVTVSDGKGGTATATINIQVNEPPNQAPTVGTQDLQKTTLTNTAVSGTVTGTDPDGDALTFSVGTNPTHGTVVVNPEGTWTYTPSNGYVGTDSFSVTVSDGKGGTATATITIQVNEPPNQAPTVGTQDLQKTTLKNTAVSGTVVGMDADGDALTYTVGTTPTHGTVVVNPDGTWTYTPSNGYVGTDSFTVTVSDGKGGTATATVTIQVNEPPNQAPTVGTQDLQKTTLKNTAVSGTVVGTDADGDTLTFSAGTTPTHGTVVVNTNGTWTYTPSNGYTGTDSFTVTVSDGKGGTATATITIQVNEPPNQAPTVVTQDLQKTTLKNTAVSGTVVGTDADGDALTYTVGTTPTHGTVVVNVDGTWTYTPSEGYVGPDSFTVVVSDGKGGTATATITVQVNEPPNELPTIGTQDLQKSTLKNIAVSGKVIGTDADGDALTFSAETNPTHGTVVVNPDGTWTYTPSNGYVGTDSFTVTVSDGKGGTTTATITIQVNEPPNQAPTVVTQDLQKTTLKNTAVSGTVVGTDADGDTLTYTVGTTPTHGTVVVNQDGTWIYTPSNGYVGTDSFTVTVSDGKGGTATATITIQVNELPNQVPTVGTQDIQRTTLKNTAVSGTVVATDADGDTLTYTVGTTPTHGTVLVNPDGTWTYTPNNGYTGTDSFTVTVSDGKGGTATATITIQVNEPPNQAPTVEAQGLNKSTLKNTPVGGTITATDADGDNSLTYTAGTTPTHGTVVVNPDGTWTYTPRNGYTGTDSFTVTVSDGKGGTTTVTITIQVNEPPAEIPTYPSTPMYMVDIEGGDYRNTVDRTPLIVGTAAASDFSLITLELTDKNGNVVERAVVSVVSGKWSYQTTKLLNTETYKVTARLRDSQSQVEYTDQQTLVIDAAEMYIQMKATPAAIVGDGKSRAVIVAVIKDANGKVIVGEKVTFAAEAGTLTKTEVITNSKGEAIVELISPDLSGTIEMIQKRIKASVANPDKGLFGEDYIVIQFLPATVSGVIVDNDTKKPIAGALIEIKEDFNKDGLIDFSTSVMTDSVGNYTVAVPYANWDYTIFITTSKKIKDRTYPVEFTQIAKVGQTTGKGESFKSESTVSGQLFMMNKETNTAERINSILQGVEIKPTVLNDPSNSLKVTVDPSGKFRITGGEKGKTYQVVFHLQVKDAKGNPQLLVGQTVSIFIPEEGIASLQAVLIDPFGIITDDVTGLPISDVKVQLYWADTALNRSKGRTPHTLVNLPILEGFAPGDNRVPQLSDKTGAYAWMVFPDGDYYIVAEKNGYVSYDSRTEGRDVPKIGEDSWIKDGVIHVGQSIVEYNFSMTALKKPGTDAGTSNQAPIIGDYVFKVKMNQTLKQTVVGTDPEKTPLTYKKYTEPKHGTVMVKKDGTFSYTPSPGFNGKDEFTIEVVDAAGVKSRSLVTIIVEKEDGDIANEKVLIETFVNRTISGSLADIRVNDPASIQVKAPSHGTIQIELESASWSYTPDHDYVGKDQFTVYYYDDKGVLYTQVVHVIVHPTPVGMGNKGETPISESIKDGSTAPTGSMKELPKTGSLFDRNLLLGAAGLLASLGLVLRRAGRRKEEN
jgi:VCBS repeat-containing protein